MGENWIEITYPEVDSSVHSPRKWRWANVKTSSRSDHWSLLAKCVCVVSARKCVLWKYMSVYRQTASSGVNIYCTIACQLISEGFKRGWPPTVTMGATCGKPLSRDTDTREGGSGGWGWQWLVEMVKNQCSGYSWDACLLKSEEESERRERRVNRWRMLGTESGGKGKKWEEEGWSEGRNGWIA